MPMQTIFDFRLPTHLIHGPGSIARLARLFTPNDKILIVTDKNLVAAGIVDRVTQVLGGAQIPSTVFDGVLVNPRAKCAHGGHRQYVAEKCTAIVAVGGGSPMDAAKMVGVLAANGGRIESYLGLNKFEHDLPPLICVPTTYGTGSEVTPFAVMTNPKSRNKDAVVSWKAVPRGGILDPELAVGLPASVGGATGMDALTHALESYVNLMATPLTETIALSAIRLVAANVRLACANDYELEATENMLIASALAGVAFAQTRLGNVHAMSHPVGAFYDAHHGTVNAVLLPYVMEFNLTARVDKYAALAEALGTDTRGISPQEAAHLAIDAVCELNQDLGIPDRLGELGVQARSIPAMARRTMDSPNVEVNPRKTAQEDIVRIFKTAL